MQIISEPNTGVSIRQILSRSTIYNRHEARRARTLALKDDPRVPLVRVMSGLPIFNLIVPPFKPQQIVAPTDFAGSTFTKTDEDKFPRYVENKQASCLGMPTFLTVGVAAACGGILSEACLGKGSAPASPFASNHSQVLARQLVPVFQYGGAAALESIRSRTKIPVSGSGDGGISLARLLRLGASAFFLFGSKAAVERFLVDNVALEKPLASVAAAALAGTLQSLSKTVTGQHVTFSREVVSVTVYFSAYEGVKHLINKDTRNRPSMLTVAISGTIAGASSVYIQGVSSLVAIRNMPFVPASPQRLSLAALRAAPYHALLFVGYETAILVLTQ